MKVLAVFDVQAQSFMRPMFVAANGVGVRMISDEVNRSAPDNLLFSHPGDFRVFELGSWDELSGQFTASGVPQLICDCSALKATS